MTTYDQNMYMYMTKSSADCVSSLKWPTLEAIFVFVCVCFFMTFSAKGIPHCYISTPFRPPVQGSIPCIHCSSAAGYNAYQYLFFVNTPFIWNSVALTKVD